MATHSSILAWRIPMDTGAQQATIHGVAKNQTPLSEKTFTFITPYSPLVNYFLFPKLTFSTLETWKKSYDKPRIKKQRHYFSNKGPPSQGYGFPVVMYGCESWTVKKAEHQRIDAFEL